jgi:hypothetical protein
MGSGLFGGLSWFELTDSVELTILGGLTRFELQDALLAVVVDQMADDPNWVAATSTFWKRPLRETPMEQLVCPSVRPLRVCLHVCPSVRLSICQVLRPLLHPLARATRALKLQSHAKACALAPRTRCV